MRVHIPAPRLDTSLSQFLEQVDKVTANWYELANYRRQNQPASDNRLIPPSQQAPQRPQGPPNQSRGGKYMKPLPFQGDPKGLQTRIPIGNSKSHAYLVDVADEGYGVYEDEAIDPEQGD